MSKIQINKYIIADPNICHGKPTFKGTRIMVWQVLDMLEAGMSIQEVLQALPSLKEKYIKAAFAYAADLTRGEDYVSFKGQLL